VFLGGAVGFLAQLDELVAHDPLGDVDRDGLAAVAELPDVVLQRRTALRLGEVRGDVLAAFGPAAGDHFERVMAAGAAEGGANGDFAALDRVAVVEGREGGPHGGEGMGDAAGEAVAVIAHQVVEGELDRLAVLQNGEGGGAHAAARPGLPSSSTSRTQGRKPSRNRVVAGMKWLPWW